MRTLTITELIPERDTLDLGNGRELEFIGRVEMDPEDIANFQSLQNRVNRIQADMAKSGTKNQQLKLAQEMNGVLGECLQRIIPGLTDDDLAELRMGVRGRILQWWTEANQQPIGDAEKNASGPDDQPQAS